MRFVRLPAAKIMKNHNSVSLHKEFVSQAIHNLVDCDCVAKVSPGEMVVCSPLGVVDNGKKLRLILDLRYVNENLAKKKFKLEDLRTVTCVFGKGDYVITFDLKSGYHHIAIAPEHLKFLGFKWLDSDGKDQFYAFRVLPFGLSTAPYIFTKITWVLTRHWRASGIRCQSYKDDGSAGHSEKHEAMKVGTSGEK